MPCGITEQSKNAVSSVLTSMFFPLLTFSKQRPVRCLIGPVEIIISYFTENWRDNRDSKRTKYQRCIIGLGCQYTCRRLKCTYLELHHYSVQLNLKIACYIREQVQWGVIWEYEYGLSIADFLQTAPCEVPYRARRSNYFVPHRELNAITANPSGQNVKNILLD
jgi:hypothetical protein